MNNKKNLKGYFGVLAKLAVAVTVFSFLALLSWQFFTFIFPAERWYYAFLGFGLTGGGAVAYFVIIKSGDANTYIRRMIALIMLILCAVGEVIVSGYGMQVETMLKQGATIDPGFTNFMVNVVQVLAFIHALALFLYYLWDDVLVWFGDEDGDGVKNYRDPDWRGKQPKPVHVLASDTEQVREPVFTPAGDNRNNSRPQKP